MYYQYQQDEVGGRWKWNKYNLHQKEKKSPTTLSIERLCVKLCLITIIILVGGRKREEKKMYTRHKEWIQRETCNEDRQEEAKAAAAMK